MGILGLSKLIADVAPFAIKENEIKNYFGEYLFGTKPGTQLTERHFPQVVRSLLTHRCACINS